MVWRACSAVSSMNRCAVHARHYAAACVRLGKIQMTLKSASSRRSGCSRQNRCTFFVLARQVLAGLWADCHAIRQKKANKCGLAEGICVVKSSKAFLREDEGKEREPTSARMTCGQLQGHSTAGEAIYLLFARSGSGCRAAY